MAFILGKRALSYYHVELKDWFAETGAYLIHAGSSSRDSSSDDQCVRRIYSKGTGGLRFKQHHRGTFCQIRMLQKLLPPPYRRYKKGSALGNSDGDAAKSAISQQMDDAMFRYMPLRQILSFAPDVSSLKELQELVDSINDKK